MQKLLKYWKHKLELDDWHIILEDDSPICNFTLKECQGETEWEATRKSAVIRIMRKDEYGKRVLPFIKEQTLIHELLHLKFALLWDNNTELQNDLLHQQIESLATALYEIKNKKS